jgi:uncharacterized protein (DUF983 family)
MGSNRSAGFYPKSFGIVLIVLALIGFPLVVSNSFFKTVLGSAGWIHLLIFWMFSLAGMWGVKIFRKESRGQSR